MSGAQTLLGKVKLHCILIIFLALNSAPCFGLEELSDLDLGSVWGQTGMGFLADHVYSYIKFDQISFDDPDGIASASTDSASLNLNRLEIDIFRLEAITPSDPLNPDKGIYDNNDFHCPYDQMIKLGDIKAVATWYGSILTYDVVDRLPVMSAASNYHASRNAAGNTANIAGLNIGLPTIELYLTETELDSITMSSTETSPYNSGKSFGHYYFKGIQMDMIDGTMEIAPHNSCGVDVAIDDVAIYGKLVSFINYQEDTPNDTAKQFRIKDLFIDVIHLNALTDLDVNGQPHSPGDNVFLKAGTQHGICNALQVDNYDFSTGRWENRFISIDLTSKLPTMSAIARTRNVAGIHIGLPALEFYMDSMEYVSTLGDHDGELLGKWRREGMDITTLEGRLEIAPHNTHGVDIALDDVVAYTSVNKLSYIDIDDNAEYCINKMEQDTLNINAITLNDSGNLTSPGDHGLHFTHLTAANAPAGFTPSPMTIDLSGRLPFMSQSTGHTMAGISIGLPTLEIYCDESGIGSISLHDLQNTASNNNAPFFQNIRFQNEKHAFLGGTVEIAPH
jgi:hypothetical protein